MPTYIGESKIVDRYLGDKFLEAAYIGDEKVFDPYTEITGYLPMIFKSRAAVALKNYRIHGTSEGAGVETGNLLDVPPTIIVTSSNNYYADYRISGDAKTQIINEFNSHLNEEYTISLNITTEYTGNTYFVLVLFYADGTNLSAYSSRRFTPTKEVVNIDFRAQYNNASGNGRTFTFNNAMIVKGSTAPTSYIPHGYKIPISNTSGVTENIINPNETEQGEGYIANTILTTTGTVAATWAWTTEYIRVSPATTYCFFTDLFRAIQANAIIVIYNSEGEVIQNVQREGQLTPVAYSAENCMTFTTPANAYYLRLSVDKNGTMLMLTEGSTAPDHYIPHRYTSDTSIYIGDSKLGEEEYVDYEEQKIYKMSEGTLVPTNPPVPLPPIPTYKGENTLSSTETLGEVTVKGRISAISP